MASEHSSDTVVQLDVRNVDEPLEDIMDALDNPPENDTLVLVNSFETEPLYDVIEQRGFTYDPSQVSPDEWRVTIEHG